MKETVPSELTFIETYLYERILKSVQSKTENGILQCFNPNGYGVPICELETLFSEKTPSCLGHECHYQTGFLKMTRNDDCVRHELMFICMTAPGTKHWKDFTWISLCPYLMLLRKILAPFKIK